MTHATDGPPALPDRSDAPAQTGNYVSANGLRIFYEDDGHGEPLVLLHGGTLTSQVWQAQTPTFATHFRVVAPDTRGHGRTDNPTGTFSHRLLADDVAAFVAALGLERPLIYGYSDGGQIALEFGMRYPELAQALVVAGATHTLSEAAIAMLAALFGDLDSPDIDMVKLEQQQPEYVAYLRTVHGSGSGDAAWQTLIRQIKPMWLTPFTYTAAELRHIHVPTLVIVGDRDETVPAADAAELYTLIPTAELAIVPNANHERAMESELTTNMVLDFVLRHRRAPA